MKKIFLLGFLLISGITLFAQDEVKKGLEAITSETIKGQMEFLASDWTEGRAVGTKGEYISADYIASMFQTFGVKPFGDVVYAQPTRAEMMAGKQPTPTTTYYQNFSLIQYEPGDEQNLSLITSKPGSESSIDFVYKTDFTVSSGTIGKSATAGLVFVGYGYTNEDKGYDDLKKVDLSGKIAVVVSGFPGHLDPESKAYKQFVPEGRNAMRRVDREKAQKLADAGAVAIIQVSSEDPTLGWAQNQIYPVKGNYYEADHPLGSYYNTRMAMPGKDLSGNLPTFTVTPRVAAELLSGIDLQEFETKAAENPQPASKVLEGKSVAFKSSVKSQIVKARNVVGIIEGEIKDEYIVVGGHYDHLGKYDGWVWNGADDNASGTIGVTTIGKAFAAAGKKPKRSIIFAAWTGEEKGLYGSTYFVDQAKEKGMNVVLNLNYDMISRDVDTDSLKNQARMVYTEANYNIEAATKKYVEDYNINLDLTYSPSEQPGGGSDHAPFAEVGIPVFYYMAAMHPDYHQPSDELSKINWDKMLNIIKIGFLSTWEFANTDEWKETK